MHDLRRMLSYHLHAAPEPRADTTGLSHLQTLRAFFYTGPIICDSKIIIYIVKIRNPTDSEGDVSPVLQVAFSEATAEGSEALTLYSKSL